MHKKSRAKLFPRFIHPSSDLGFKSLLLNPANKPILLALLNATLEHLGENAIIDLDYLPTEHLGLDAERMQVESVKLKVESIRATAFFEQSQPQGGNLLRKHFTFYTFRFTLVKTFLRYSFHPILNFATCFAPQNWRTLV